MKRIALAALAAFFVSACATQPVETVAEAVPALVPVGSVLQGAIPICDTEESMRAVWDAHVANGRDAAAQVWAKYARTPGANGGPLCGMSRYRVLLIGVHEYAELRFPEGVRPANLATVKGMDGNTYWSILFRKPAKPEGTET